MSLHLDWNTKSQPEWKDYIGKEYSQVNKEILGHWPNSIIIDALGYNGHRCVEYRDQLDRALVFFDNQDQVIDVFVYSIGLDEPEKPFR